MFGQSGVEQPAGVAITLSCQQDNWVRLDPARDKGKHLRGRAVQPMRVLDEYQHRGFSRDLRDQVERRHRDLKRLSGDFVRETERRVERSLLNGRELTSEIAHRPKQLVQSGKTQTSFRLHPADREDSHSSITGLACCLREQARLTDARLAAEHEDRAALLHAVQQAGDELHL